MKCIDEYNTIKELEVDFNNWFGWLLSGWDYEKGCFIDSYIERDFTDDKIEMMLAITEWYFDEDDLKTMSKYNLVYWYCVRLLYLYNDSQEYLYLNDVFDFLDNVRPF